MPHFEKQDGCHMRFLTFSKEFCWPSRAKDIIARDLEFAGYVHHYKPDWKYFWPHFEKQDSCHGHFFPVKKSAYISLVIGSRGLA